MSSDPGFASGTLFTRAAAALFAGIAGLSIIWLPDAGAESRLSLKEAVQIALEQNDMVRAEAMGLEAAEKGVDEARSNLLPKVIFEERFLRTDNPAYVFSTAINQGRFSSGDLQGAPDSFNNPDAVNDFETSLMLEQAVFSRKAFLGLDMARTASMGRAMEYERRREEVAFKVYKAYLGALSASAFLEAAESAEKNAEEHLRLAGVREQTGVGLASDRLRAGVALGEARMNLIKVRNDLEIAKRGLALAMGMEEPVMPADVIPKFEAESVDAFLASVDSRSDILAMEKMLDNAGNNVKLAEAEFIPELALFGGVQANDRNIPLGTDGTSYRVGAALRWELFSGFGSSARRAGAIAEKNKTIRMLEGMKKEARFRVREAWLRAAEAAEARQLAEEALASAEEGTRLIRVRYENGLSTMVALLDSQTALNRARADVVRTRMAVYEADGVLRFMAGNLLDTLMEVPEAAGGR